MFHILIKHALSTWLFYDVTVFKVSVFKVSVCQVKKKSKSKQEHEDSPILFFLSVWLLWTTCIGQIS